MFDVQYYHSKIKIKSNLKEKESSCSLSLLWELYCEDMKILFTIEDKKRLQKHDWSTRPLSLESEYVQYAAHDSFFLLSIAKRISNRLDEAQLAVIHKEFNARKVQLTKHRLRSQAFDQYTSYKSYFNKHVAPVIRKKEDQVLIQYVFRAIFNFRELKSQDLDCSPRSLLKDGELQAIAIRLPDNKASLMSIMEDASGMEDETLNDFVESTSRAVKESINEFKTNQELRATFMAEVEKEKANRAGVSKQASKDERRQKMQQQYSCKKAVYENCRIFGPDGQHLCNCNTKKAMWYVHKGLGTIIADAAEEESQSTQNL